MHCQGKIVLSDMAKSSVSYYFHSNHDEYVGDWVDGKRHGSGELACTDGSLYDGQWRNDLFNGQGTNIIPQINLNSFSKHSVVNSLLFRGY